MEIVVLGNCQARGLAHALGLYLPHARTQAVPITADPAKLGKILQTVTAKKFDLLVVHEPVLKLISKHQSLAGILPETAIVVPTIRFSAFHPDTQYAYTGGRTLKETLAASGILGSFFGHSQNGLSREEARRLFRSDVYEALGYFDEWSLSVGILKEAFDRTALDFTKWIRRNQRLGVFMHGLNHPVALALATVAEQIVEREYAGQTRVICGIDRYLTDHLANIVWPVYPEIASVLGVRGDYLWRRGDRVVDLNGFIDLTFSLWESANWRAETCRVEPSLSESERCALADLTA